jgi:hypothetical protein
VDGEEKTCQGFKVILVKAEYAKTLSQRRVALEQVYADGCYIEGMVWKWVEDRVMLVPTFFAPILEITRLYWIHGHHRR